MERPLERGIRWIRSRSRRGASTKLINLKLITRALITFTLIIPVSAMILSQCNSLSESSSHTSKFRNVIDFNLLEGLNAGQHQMARRSLLQARGTPTGFPPPGANDHGVVSRAPHFSRRPSEFQSRTSPPSFQPPSPRFIHPPPIPP